MSPQIHPHPVFLGTPNLDPTSHVHVPLARDPMVQSDDWMKQSCQEWDLSIPASPASNVESWSHRCRWFFSKLGQENKIWVVQTSLKLTKTVHPEKLKVGRWFVCCSFWVEDFCRFRQVLHGAEHTTWELHLRPRNSPACSHVHRNIWHNSGFSRSMAVMFWMRAPKLPLRNLGMNPDFHDKIAGTNHFFAKWSQTYTPEAWQFAPWKNDGWKSL